MMVPFLQYASLAVFAVGALAFSWLAWSYWRERRAGQLVFRLFTLVCAGAFLMKLTVILFGLSHPVLEYLRDLLVGAVPPMMLHLLLERERWDVLPGRAAWRAVLGALYLSVVTPQDESLPTLRLAVIAFAGLLVLVWSRRERSQEEAWHGVWNLAIFTGLCTAALASHYGESPLYDLLPDYLLLAFVAVWLYYCERLAFLDVFLKRGPYFLCGAALIGLMQTAMPVLALFPVWLLGLLWLSDQV